MHETRIRLSLSFDGWVIFSFLVGVCPGTGTPAALADPGGVGAGLLAAGRQKGRHGSRTSPGSDWLTCWLLR